MITPFCFLPRTVTRNRNFIRNGDERKERIEYDYAYENEYAEEENLPDFVRVADLGTVIFWDFQVVEDFYQSVLLIGFAMDDEHFAEAFRLGLEPGAKFMGIGVGGKAVEGFDVAFQGVFAAENGDFGFPFDDSSAEGVHGLEADDQDGIFRVGNIVGEVVEDTSRLAHSAGGDNHARLIEGVQGLGFLGQVDEPAAAVAEDFAVLGE